MQSRLFVAFQILLALPECSEEVQSQDRPSTPPRESSATEVPGTVGNEEMPEIELQTPVGFD